jgi:glycosyltransferase involved in cell wall biosynthesis
MHAQPAVSVVVPTLATKERAPFLLRAIASVLAQSHVRATPIVVANGPTVDADLLAHLRRRRDIRLVRLGPADLSGALAAGREAIDTSSFSELDDDDLLLPDALATRVDALFGDAVPDVVVSEGIIRSAHGDRRCIGDIAAVRLDPLRSLMRRSWLLPGATLFRTEHFPASLFATLPRYLERTYLAAVLATRFKVCFVETPTVMHFVGNPFSMDASHDCCIGRAGAIRRLLELPLTQEVRRIVRDKICAAEHHASVLHLGERRYRAAWVAHLRSLATRRGGRYLGYTRHLLRLRTGLPVPVLPLAGEPMEWH